MDVFFSFWPLVTSACIERSESESSKYAPNTGQFSLMGTIQLEEGAQESPLQDCLHLLVDVLSTENQPLMTTQASSDGTFTIQLPKPPNHPLRIHAFCYASDVDFKENVPLWQSDPFLYLPSSTNAIILKMAGNNRPQEPAIQEIIPSEYSTWLENPYLVEFYALRHPDHLEPPLGASLEIRNGGLNAETRLTYLWAVYRYLEQQLTPKEAALLLPTNLHEINTSVESTDIQLQIAENQLRETCAFLNSPCPYSAHLRQQSWISKDKRTVTDVESTTTRARIWLATHILIQHLLQEGLTLPNNLPTPTEIAGIQQSTDARYQEIRDKLYQLYVTQEIQPPPFL